MSLILLSHNVTYYSNNHCVFCCIISVVSLIPLGRISVSIVLSVCPTVCLSHAHTGHSSLPDWQAARLVCRQTDGCAGRCREQECRWVGGHMEGLWWWWREGGLHLLLRDAYSGTGNLPTLCLDQLILWRTLFFFTTTNPRSLILCATILTMVLINSNPTHIR